jgi:hypothetical protein
MDNSNDSKHTAKLAQSLDLNLIELVQAHVKWRLNEYPTPSKER